MNTPANLLLVDDEPRNLDVLEEILGRPDYRLVRASSAEEALLALLREDFAVIVLDIQMPGVSGIELASLVKQRERTRHVPIIFLTAFYQDEQRMMQGYSAGAVDYLTKPVNSDVLRSKVAVFVELFRQTAALEATNAALEQQVAQRRKAEEALRDANDELESRVDARTAALREARDAAERAGRAKDDFLAALSHELRTPLNPVLLIASEAATNAAFPEEARAQFASIRKNVELEARLIDDLLDLTRITRGKLALDLHVTDLRQVIQDAIATVQTEIAQKRIALSVAFGPARIPVHVDPVRIQQVIWNVLKNAIKFTPEGGAIRVQAEAPLGANAATIEIADTGIGLIDDEIARIFDAFSQGNHALGSGSHRFGGLGLGLTISQSLVAHHQGAIRARSDGPGRGATFAIELPLYGGPPLAEPAQPATTATLGQQAPEIGGRRLLLVEDHEPTRHALERLLTRRNFAVASAASVADALALAMKEKFELLVSDIGLPDGSGFELMSEMKRKYGMRGIALTGYGMEEDIQRSREAGFQMHLTKPVVVQSLDRALREVLAET